MVGLSRTSIAVHDLQVTPATSLSADRRGKPDVDARMPETTLQPVGLLKALTGRGLAVIVAAVIAVGAGAGFALANSTNEGPSVAFFSGAGGSGLVEADPYSDWELSDHKDDKGGYARWTSDTACGVDRAAAGVPTSINTLVGWSIGRLGPIYFLQAAPERFSQIDTVFLLDPGSRADMTAEGSCDVAREPSATLKRWLSGDAQRRLVVLSGRATESDARQGLADFYLRDLAGLDSQVYVCRVSQIRPHKAAVWLPEYMPLTKQEPNCPGRSRIPLDEILVESSSTPPPTAPPEIRPPETQPPPTAPPETQPPPTAPPQTAPPETQPPPTAPPPRPSPTQPPPTQPPATSPPPTSPPTAPPQAVITVRQEQQGRHGADTFANPTNASGKGPRIEPGAWVEVSCKLRPSSTIASASPDGYWYRIHSAPWNNQYYAVANTFMNGDTPATPQSEWHNTDMSVPDC